jgi:hypothetical protein
MVRLGSIRPVVNGMGTDHPIPDLPFVDDSHIPLDDPKAVEAIGRDVAEGMWGRYDPCRGDTAGWVVFTTDPKRIDLAWCVRWHPEHGRSVVLYRHADISSVHMAYWSPALAFRSGNYWWDGTCWYRPAQVVNRAIGNYLRRPVPGATTVTVADLLRTGGDARLAGALHITDVDLDAPVVSRWLNHLAWWAEHRTGDRPLDQCVAKLSAPELNADELVNVNGMAEVAEVAASTLRAYVTRGQNDVPLPQVTLNGRAMWSRPVAEEWAEARRASDEGITELISGSSDGSTPAPGVAQARDRFTHMFFSRLWDYPAIRKRWALRWRTEPAIREIARELAWYAAADIPHLVPMPSLATVLFQAVLHDLADYSRDDVAPFGIMRDTAKMLDWLIHYEPEIAASTIGDITSEARRKYGHTNEDMRRTFNTALSMDGTLDTNTRREFLRRVLPDPDTTT